ncbi:MAG: DUF3791 domain-containing protein [Lactobacillales bacterium]|jgi:hypothetical protein|nr:DUF3791 domain-containing protein [Lactobacillales bacterium]
MSKEQVIATWVAFMISATAKRYQLSNEGVTELVKEYDLLAFLIDNYEYLHYYDNDFITEDVMKYIAERGGSLNELSRAS